MENGAPEPSREGQIIVSDNKRSWRSYFRAPRTKRGQIITLIIVAVLVFAGTSAGLYYMQSEKQTQTPEEQTVPARDPNRPLTPYEEASSLAYSGKYDEAMEGLDKKIESADDDTEKYNLLLAKSDVARENEKYQQALQYAREADGLNPTRQSAILVAIAAEELSDTETALEFYKKVVERTDEDTKRVIPEDFQYYLDKIEELEANVL